MNQTLELLREMKLKGFIRGIEEQSNSALYSDLTFEERIAHLASKEYNLRCNRRIERNLSQAKLKQQASIEDVDFQCPRGLKKSQIIEFSQCNWIEKAHNLLINGPTGVGKTFLACAFANSACRRGFSAKYEKTASLLMSLSTARLDGSYPRQQSALSKVKVLILDEWLRDRLNATQAREVLDLLDERDQRTSTIFVSQLPVDKWHEHIEDPTIADAILDRILHNAQKVNMKGESMRKLRSNSSLEKAVKESNNSVSL